MLLSMCSDYAKSTGCAEDYLRKISDAGFDGIQWIHQWNTDFIYTKPEIRQLKNWLKDFGLRLFDVHGTAGVEKQWFSTTEYERQAGVEIVTNRIEMASELGADVVVMHVPRLIPENSAKWGQLKKSIRELEPLCRKTGVRIAIENIFYDAFNGIDDLMKEFAPDCLGICYDSGHGNMGQLGLDRVEKHPGRLISLHLHDNNGYDDQHKPLFSGTVEWDRLARIIANSTYSGPLTLEVIIWNSFIQDESVFLKQVYSDGKKLAGMIEGNRK